MSTHAYKPYRLNTDLPETVIVLHDIREILLPKLKRELEIKTQGEEDARQALLPWSSTTLFYNFAFRLLDILCEEDTIDIARAYDLVQQEYTSALFRADPEAEPENNWWFSMHMAIAYVVRLLWTLAEKDRQASEYLRDDLFRDLQTLGLTLLEVKYQQMLVQTLIRKILEQVNAVGLYGEHLEDKDKHALA